MASNSTILDVLFTNGSKNISYLPICILLLCVGVLALFLLGSTGLDPREPPLVPSKVPVIGHLIGLIKDEADYFGKVVPPTSPPIFTLKIFSSRVYVITSPKLVQSVYRNAKTLTTDELILEASKKVFNATEATLNFFKDRPAGSTDKYPQLTKVREAMQTSMSQGQKLLQMNARALNRVAVILNDITTAEEHQNLYQWVKEAFVVASAEAIYGPVNPISENISLIRHLDNFEDSVGILFLNFFPSITASKAYRARLLFEAAFGSYYNRNLYQDASELIQNHHAVCTSVGLTANDMKNYELGILMGATVNSVPSIFWILVFIFSDPSLLAEIRAEVMTIVTYKSDNDGNKEACLDVSQLQKSCPLLAATWQETLRMRGSGVSNRAVEEDIILDSTYLLKAGSMIQILSRHMNMDPSIWGPTVNTFDAKRFLKENLEQVDKEQRKLQRSGLVPFGGGVSLCPGRHFATTEILGVAATLVVGYELRMKDGGQLKVPKVKMQPLSRSVLVPADELDVLIRRREEFERIIWTYDVGDGIGNENTIF